MLLTKSTMVLNYSKTFLMWPSKGLLK